MKGFYDVQLKVKENLLKAHRVVLACHSEFFAKRLNNNAVVSFMWSKKENQPIICFFYVLQEIE